MTDTATGEGLRDRVVLITGGTGSFGRTFVRAALDAGARRVIAIARHEDGIRRLALEIGDDRLSAYVADVRDADAMRRVCQARDLYAIVHAAALKQVPLGETQPYEFVKTNVIGSINVIEAALDAGVPRVLAISTDKACAPVTLYGATKAVMERVVAQANIYRGTHGTRLACVRYGNVIGSTGSVLPYWEGQMEKGDPLTVTDAFATRFFLTLRDGVAFVLHALDAMRGGEVFVPKVKACAVIDLARALSGASVIDVVGLRPFEKQHELLISRDEMRDARDFGWCYALLPPVAPWADAPSPDAWPRVPMMEFSSADADLIEPRDVVALYRRFA